MNEAPPLYSVSELAARVRRTLETGYGRVRVRGEISNWRPAASGHAYFVLKDDRAQLRAVLFRSDGAGVRFAPGDGIEVEVDGEITVYEARGDLQIIVRRMVPSGVGALLQALEALRRRLAAEGLFDDARKRSLPRFPRVIGVVTSPTGAAVRDILKVLGRRWPAAQVVFLPVAVQGVGAAAEIAGALDRLSRWGGADVIIVGRGGGSLEDLWAFNEEPVVRAIAASRTPVVSAVGHETDWTLADLASDVRAPTPSAAAEMVAPDAETTLRMLATSASQLERGLRDSIASRGKALDGLIRAYGFRRPERFLERRAEDLDAASRRLDDALRYRVDRDGDRLRELGHRLRACHPGRTVAWSRERVQAAGRRLRTGFRSGFEARRDRLGSTARALGALDPTGVLGRGYALVRAGAGGGTVTAASQLAAGDPVLVQFREDRFHGRVERIDHAGPWTSGSGEAGEDDRKT